MRRSLPAGALMLIVGAAAAPAGCDARDAGAPAGDADRAAGQPSPWHTGSMIALPDAEHDAELHAAIDEARATADAARERWAATAQSLRTRWAVKWAAELAGGGVEYLWVQPLHWSPFRIEGALASEPVGRLAGANREPPALGDLVSFPIEDLADWVHYLRGDVEGPREGGFTIAILEARYGRP